MKSVLRLLGIKKSGGESKKNLRSQGASANLKKISSIPVSSENTFQAPQPGGDVQSRSPFRNHPRSPRVHSYNSGDLYHSDAENYVPNYHVNSSPDIVGHHLGSQRTMMGDETFSQLAVNNSSDTLSQGYPGYYSPANRHHNSHQFHQQMGGGGGTYQSFGGGGGREEHTPDLLSAGELQQSITFHSPLWMKRDFPSRSSLRRKAMTGRRLPSDMSVRFNDPGIYEESMTDSEVMRRNKISQHQQNQNQIYMKTNEPSDIDTDVFTDAESTNSGRKGRKGKKERKSKGDNSHQSNKFFSRHASLKIRSGKRRNDKNQMLGVVSENSGIADGGTESRRASVPDSKRSLTDTEQRGTDNYDETDFSEAENSIFNVAMPSFISSLNFNKLSGGRINSATNGQNGENFKRQGSTGNLMRRPFSALRNHPSGTASNYSENEMTDSARSVKKSLSSDNFQGSGILGGVGGVNSSTVKHKVGQGLAQSSLVVPSTKASRKQSKANMEDNMISLFEAVEVCNLDKVTDLLNVGVRDLNAPNEDDFTVLDLATLLNFDLMAAELLKHGAKENPKFMVKELRIQHVNHLLKRCDAQIHVLLPALVTAAQSSSANASQKSSVSGLPKETELRFWEWRQRLLAKMKACFELARAPDPPTKIEISVTSSTSVRVSFTAPKTTNGSLVTRYKIAWSKSALFDSVEGEHVLLDLRELDFVIRGLTPGVEIFVRVSAANIKGFGPAQLATPPSATPSNWRDICNKERRCSGKKVTELSLMYEQVKYACLGLNLQQQDNGSPSKQRNLKHLMPTHPKFSKSLTKGVYLSCALYTPDDRVVVTSDDVIPTVEVDEGTPANISQDFHWFLKLSVVWDDMATVCQELSVTSSNTSISFRAKLVQAVFSLQSLLSWRDVGRVYHRVLRDNHGNMIFVLIGHLPDNKCPSGSGVKLSPLSKVVGKRKPKLDLSLSMGAGGETSSLSGGQGSINASSNVAANFSSSLLDDFSALDMLFLDLEELIRFHQNQETSLKPGLYLTLVKAESSINTLNVQVPYHCPNMSTCVRMRENAHVSREEWAWIYNSNMPIQNSSSENPSNLSKSSSNPSSSGMMTSSGSHHAISQQQQQQQQAIHTSAMAPSSASYGLTMSQANFRRSLAIAAGKLFKKLAIKDDNGYRIYKDEIIEVNSDVSVILMLPPEVTSVNKYSDSLSSNHSNGGGGGGHSSSSTPAQLVPLTVQLFEFTHLMVYQHYITSAYCRLCCLVDNLTLVANYQIREAFTDEEMRGSKKRLETLSEVADKTEIIWHSMRWLLDILQQNRMARNKLGIHLKTLLDTTTNVVDNSALKTSQSQNSLPNGSQKHFVPGVSNSGSQSHLSNALRNMSQNQLSSNITNVSSKPQSSKCIVLQVFPRFNCGLPRGTSVRVVINSKATCKDVVQLVVSELSKVALSHNPLLTWDANPDLFQLCVLFGDNMEQTLPEHLPPVHSVDYHPNSVKYIVKLKTNANFFSKYSDI